ncbi:unnamed protein product, partial [Effrenium voratum]
STDKAHVDVGTMSISQAIGLAMLPVWCMLTLAGASSVSRSFALMDEERAFQLLEEGFLDVRHLPQGKDMASRIVISVNAAIVNICHALRSSRKLESVQCPGPFSGHALADKEVEAVTWGFAEIPGVAKLALLGGPCGGKTKSGRRIRDVLEKEPSKFQVFRTPEIATVLFLQGAMSNGTYQNFVPEEYIEFIVQCEILQIVFEGIWAQGAALSSGSATGLLLTDRDALDGKSYSRPVDESQPVSWSRILLKVGERLKIPGLSDDDLAKRYLGAVFWHTAASHQGRLDVEAYSRP